MHYVDDTSYEPGLAPPFQPCWSRRQSAAAIKEHDAIAIEKKHDGRRVGRFHSYAAKVSEFSSPNSAWCSSIRRGERVGGNWRSHAYALRKPALASWIEVTVFSPRRTQLSRYSRRLLRGPCVHASTCNAAAGSYSRRCTLEPQVMCRGVRCLR